MCQFGIPYAPVQPACGCNEHAKRYAAFAARGAE